MAQPVVRLFDRREGFSSPENRSLTANHNTLPRKGKPGVHAEKNVIRKLKKQRTATRVNVPRYMVPRIMIDRLGKDVDMISRHFDVLELVLENEPIGIVKISNETGHEHYEVRYSLRLLEEKQLIEPTNNGAIATERTDEYVADLDEKIDAVNDKLEEIQISEELEVDH